MLFFLPLLLLSLSTLSRLTFASSDFSFDRDFDFDASFDQNPIDDSSTYPITSLHDFKWGDEDTIDCKDDSSKDTYNATSHTTDPVSSASETPEALIKERRSVLMNLLSHLKHLPSLNSIAIPWNHVSVQGWPPGVLFYSSALWDWSDLRALRGCHVTFVKRPCPLPVIPYHQRRSLFMQLKGLSARVYGADRIIPFKEVFMGSFTGMHLTSYDFRVWTAEDVEWIRRIIEYLSSSSNGSSISGSSNITSCDSDTFTFAITDTITHNYTSFNVPQSQSSQASADRDLLHHLLLQKYTLLYPSATEIDFSTVRLTGWPSEVIFYNRSNWTPKNISLLKEHISAIQFHVRAEESLRPDPTPLERSQMYFGLLNGCREVFGIKGNIPWLMKLKPLLPTLHLSGINYERWNGNDLAQVGVLIEKLDEIKGRSSVRVRKRKRSEE